MTSHHRVRLVVTNYTRSYAAPSTYLYKGYMKVGWSYFYCQTPGAFYSDLGYTNTWWLKTDDDARNRGVWVSAVYISSGSNNLPVPGVPRC